MRLFGRRRAAVAEPHAGGLVGDAAAMRAALDARRARLAASGWAAAALDVRAIMRDLLSGEIEAPTQDVAALIRRGVDPDRFYERELAPSWEDLGEAQRAARVDGFLELSRMLGSGDGGGLPEGMAETVRTKMLVLAWAFDEAYGYVARLARGEDPSSDEEE
jgi:hypothetical protein